MSRIDVLNKSKIHKMTTRKYQSIRSPFVFPSRILPVVIFDAESLKSVAQADDVNLVNREKEERQASNFLYIVATSQL